MRERNIEKFTQSYIYRENGEKYFVSTGYRRSSAALNPDSWYFDTLAWRLDENDECTDWIADHSGARTESGALKQHFEVVKQLHEKGIFHSETEDDLLSTSQE